MSFLDVIDSYSAAAETLFDTAESKLKTASGEDLKQAQTQVATALGQLGQAAAAKAGQVNQNGLAELIQYTNLAAKDVCAALSKAVGVATPDPVLIGALSNALAVLAQISPVVLQARSSSGGGT